MNSDALPDRVDPAFDALAGAVGGRARAVSAAVRRLDGLLPTGSATAGRVDPGDRRDLTLRLLRVAGDPQADDVLRLVAGQPLGTRRVAELLGRGRVGLWETVADLIGVGLLEHEPTRDELSATPAGRAVLDLVARCCADTAIGGAP